MEALGSFLAFVIMTVVYFIPTYVAVKRQHPNKLAIFILNLFLGITFIGWVVALIWAVMNTTPAPSDAAETPPPVQTQTPMSPQIPKEPKKEEAVEFNNHIDRNTVTAAMEKQAVKNNSKPAPSDKNDTTPEKTK